MAGFGGAVKLTGADEYKKSLNDITRSLKVVSAEMKATASAFDAGDISEQDLKKQTDSLTASLNSQKSALDAMKGELAKMVSQYEQNASAHQKLVSEYESEKAKLEDIKSRLGEGSDEYKKQLAVVADYEQAVQKSAKALDADGKAVDDMRIKTANAETTINQTAKSLDDMGDSAEESGKEAEKASGGYTVFKNVLANLATQAINAVLAGLKKMGEAFLEVGKQALEGYAEFEQLQGGVEKLFGEDAPAVIEKASQAFATAGMDANTYLETVTGFSASLIAGLEGDTTKAVELSDMAIRDMADNANVFGTSMESIQNAYAGFAKGNFSMLDSLKLGYGGTKTEMLRLVKDAGVVEESVKSLDDVSFDQMIEAIHIIQEQMNITGTTANEASYTIEGSLNAMRGAWSNLVTGMADDNADIESLAESLVSTLITEDGKGGVLGQIIPRITKIVQGIGQTMNVLMPQLTQAIVPLIQSALPVLADALMGLLTGLMDLLPTIIPIIAQLIPDICTTLISLLPQIVDVGIDLILALIDGIADELPTLLGVVLPEIVKKIIKTLLDKLPDILNTGLKLMGSLIAGITGAIGQVLKAIRDVGTAIWNGIKERVTDMVNAGRDLVRGIWEGISNSFQWIKDKIKGWVGNVTSFIKRLFGIASPSKLFRDEIGENLALGIGEGFSDEMRYVSAEMADAIPKSFDVDATVKGGTGAVAGMESIVSAFKEALSQMQIVLDDEQMGRFVDNTVSRLVYA